MALGLLEGICVLDLGPEIAAPFCARLLADYGADVVKVEPPGEGDPARRMGPFAGNEPHPERSIPFLYLNTNKRGVTLDISCESGREVWSKLLRGADVVVHGFTPQRAESLGLDYGSLASINPGLVAASITAFGMTEPYRDFSATDIVICAMSGLMYHSGDSDRGAAAQFLEPVPLRCRGECRRRHRGRPIPPHDPLAWASRWTFRRRNASPPTWCRQSPSTTTWGRSRGGVRCAVRVLRNSWPARDGYVVASVQGSQPWSTVAELIGLEALQHEKFASGAGRVEHGEELKALLIEGLAKWDRKPLFQASGERRLVFGMAQDAGDLFDCPQLRERGFYIEVDHPATGAAEYPGMGPRLSEGAFEIRYPAPLLGQHNREVYEDELGYSDEELAALQESGAI